MQRIRLEALRSIVTQRETAVLLRHDHHIARAVLLVRTSCSLESVWVVDALRDLGWRHSELSKPNLDPVVNNVHQNARHEALLRNWLQFNGYRLFLSGQLKYTAPSLPVNPMYILYIPNHRIDLLRASPDHAKPKYDTLLGRHGPHELRFDAHIGSQTFVANFAACYQDLAVRTTGTNVDM
jgi:hypothetical protein